MISAQQFRQLLMIMENQVGIAIFTGHCVGPQLFHEKHLVRKLRIRSISGWPSFFYPVSQMTHEIKEEISFRLFTKKENENQN